jgi:sugar lactone lactonase YvrE
MIASKGDMKLRAILAIAILVVLLPVSAIAHPATGIVCDRAGNIYFSDLETIWKIDTSGRLSVFRPGVSGRHVHELAIDEQDNIYGADFSYESQKFINDIWKMTPAGRFEYLLEPTDKPPRGMSIWRDRAGNNYLVDQNNHSKTQTLLLRRSPDGGVMTLAGGAYGHADGKGTAARFSAVGNLAFGPDGSPYLTDGATVRRVATDGTVATLASGLNVRTAQDKPTLFGGSDQNLTGIAVDSAGTVFAADSENRRLFKIMREGKTEIVLRVDPPYFPNGVFAGPGGEVYVLEISFTPPGSWGASRVRRLSADGRSTILATVGVETPGASPQASVVPSVEISAKIFLSTFLSGQRFKFGMVILAATILGGGVILWQRRKRQRV